ncbi:MAG TPA: type 4a pilus biogenesis protein PilO [Atribacterota bacterium]|nr:type 4a pilus biogenesis protein PilO [Atribacterota bacterium]HPK87024.1 type 4a pilus biogenesis protein PilO [Atribacterota bacterium]
MKLSKNVKIIISLVLFIVFAYFNYSFIYQPRKIMIEQLNQQIGLLQSKIEEGRRVAARLEALKKEYRELTERLEFVEVLLPKEKEIPEFLVLLQETMDEFHIDFSNFTPQNLVQERDTIYATLPISMTFTANYFDTIQFLDRLENFPRIVAVKDLNLNPVGENSGDVSGTMNLFTYVLMKGN